MRTARSLTVSRSIYHAYPLPTTHAPLCHPPPCHACPPPHTPPTSMQAPHHAHPPAMHTPTMHASYCHACPHHACPPATPPPPHNACPPCHACPLWTEFTRFWKYYLTPTSLRAAITMTKHSKDYVHLCGARTRHCGSPRLLSTKNNITPRISTDVISASWFNTRNVITWCQA